MLSDTWAMQERLKVLNTDIRRVPKGKARAYAVLYHVNEGFEQILTQLKHLDNTGAWRQVRKDSS
jgi:hypothetical protein